MEISEQLKVHDMELDLQWVKRDLNQEADELSNEDFRNFDPTMRIDLDPKSLKWILLEELASKSTELYESIVKAKAEKSKTSQGRGARKRKHEKLESL